MNATARVRRSACARILIAGCLVSTATAQDPSPSAPPAETKIEVGVGETKAIGVPDTLKVTARPMSSDAQVASVTLAGDKLLVTGLKVGRVRIDFTGERLGVANASPGAAGRVPVYDDSRAIDVQVNPGTGAIDGGRGRGGSIVIPKVRPEEIEPTTLLRNEVITMRRGDTRTRTLKAWSAVNSSTSSNPGVVTAMARGDEVTLTARSAGEAQVEITGSGTGLQFGFGGGLRPYEFKYTALVRVVDSISNNEPVAKRFDIPPRALLIVEMCSRSRPTITLPAGVGDVVAEDQPAALRVSVASGRSGRSATVTISPAGAQATTADATLTLREAGAPADRPQYAQRVRVKMDACLLTGTWSTGGASFSIEQSGATLRVVNGSRVYEGSVNGNQVTFSRRLDVPAIIDTAAEGEARDWLRLQLRNKRDEFTGTVSGVRPADDLQCTQLSGQFRSYRWNYPDFEERAAKVRYTRKPNHVRIRVVPEGT